MKTVLTTCSKGDLLAFGLKVRKHGSIQECHLKFLLYYNRRKIITVVFVKYLSRDYNNTIIVFIIPEYFLSNSHFNFKNHLGRSIISLVFEMKKLRFECVEFPGAALTKCYQLRGLNHRACGLIVLETRNLR